MDKIRNFCIIAHIDHGKSTIADRMMELTGTVEKREMKAQLLDSMELEREKGITIKLAPVTMKWKGCTLNLIDTPGHVDFSYKIDLPAADVEKTAAEIMNLLGCSREEFIEVSGKTGQNVDKILDVLSRYEAQSLRALPVDNCLQTKALIFDSYFDDYRGVVLYVRIFEGEILKNSEILMMGAETKGVALEVAEDG